LKVAFAGNEAVSDGCQLTDQRICRGGTLVNRIALLLVVLATAASVVALTARASGHADEEASPMASPIYGITIPAGYRDWKLLVVDQLLVPGKADQLRAQFGNDIAIQAYQEKTIPFPDGAIIAAIHWNRVPSEGNNKVLGVDCPVLNLSLSGPP
jgi:hypothetical protein